MLSNLLMIGFHKEKRGYGIKRSWIWVQLFVVHNLRAMSVH